jgi:hypothetical protein
MCCEISSSQSSFGEVYSLLGSNVMSSGKETPTFRKNVPSFWANKCIRLMLWLPSSLKNDIK